MPQRPPKIKPHDDQIALNGSYGNILFTTDYLQGSIDIADDFQKGKSEEDVGSSIITDESSILNGKDDE